MARALGCVIGAAAIAGCTLVDSVDGYEGPAASGGTAGAFDGGGVGGGAGSGGTGGSSGAAGASCTLPAECDDDDLCTDDACWGGGCINDAIDPATIPDDNTCTDDFCDPKSGIQHVLPSSPALQVLQCGSVTCPAGYYVRKLSCIPECGACDPTFCVNGGNDCEAADCPSGYAMGATLSTGDCGCGPGNAMLCTR
jgi:hypothetical protein